jgi:hypothetical protein
MLLVFILPVYRLISNMVSEKETKARESMKIMGLKDLSYWASWFVFHFIRVTIISALSTLILSFNVVVKSNPFIVFLFFWIFGNSLFAFSLFIQSFFSRERIAALCGTLIYFGSSFLNIVVGDEKIPERFKYAGSLISTVAVIRGSETLAYFEIKDEGLHFWNIDRLLRFFSFQGCLVMMVASFIVFLVLGLYLDNVFPSIYGLRKHPLYCLTRGYWCRTANNRRGADRKNPS